MPREVTMPRELTLAGSVVILGGPETLDDMDVRGVDANLLQRLVGS